MNKKEAMKMIEMNTDVTRKIIEEQFGVFTTTDKGNRLVSQGCKLINYNDTKNVIADGIDAYMPVRFSGTSGKVDAGIYAKGIGHNLEEFVSVIYSVRRLGEVVFETTDYMEAHHNLIEVLEDINT